MKEKIRQHFREHKNEIRKKSLSLLSELVSIKSVNPGKANLKEYPYLTICGEEGKVVEVLKKYLDKAGFKYSVYEKIKGRGNLISGYGDGPKGLCVGVHLDVVPPGDRKLWNTDPFTMTEKDGFVYGRGVLDNKGPIVSCVMAMEMLRDIGLKLNGKFMLAAIAGEEFHEKDEPDPGFKFLVEEGYLKPDFAIIPDIGENMKNIDIAEKGRAVLKVTSIGKQAHGATPEKGINAVFKMAQFLNNVEKIELTYKPHDTLKKPTLNLGIIKGGAVANSVADTCEVILDIRYLPGQTTETIIADLKKCTEGIKDGNFRFDVEDDNLPHQLDPDNELVAAIQRNAEAVLGIRPEPIGQGGGTFAKGFNLCGIKAVGFGPGDDNAFHVSNEYLEIEQMLQFAELLACISVDLLG